MKFVVVNEIPGRRSSRQHLIEKINAFADGDHDFVQIEYEGDYTSVKSANNSITGAVRRSGRAVRLVQRGNDLYLMKIKSE